MASTYTLTNNVELIATSEKVDTWGASIDANFTRVDEMADGILSVSVSGDVTLVAATDATDQVHYAIINIIGGAGGNIIFPNKTGQWVVRNGSSGTVTFKNSTGSTTNLVAGEVGLILNDGANCFALGVGSGSLKAYIDASEAAAKSYADGLAFGASPSAVPSPTGNAGKYLTNNGTTTNWSNVQQSDVSGLPATLTAIQNLAFALAIVF